MLLQLHVEEIMVDTGHEEINFMIFWIVRGRDDGMEGLKSGRWSSWAQASFADWAIVPALRREVGGRVPAM